MIFLRVGVRGSERSLQSCEFLVSGSVSIEFGVNRHSPAHNRKATLSGPLADFSQPRSQHAASSQARSQPHSQPPLTAPSVSGAASGAVRIL